MVICSVFIVGKSGGLIFHQDHNMPKIETEKVFDYPLDLQLQCDNSKKIVVAFGHRDNICVGHELLAVEGKPLVGMQTEDGKDVLELISKKENYPMKLKFGHSLMTSNDRIRLASTFYGLFAFASQLSPEPKCSGIEMLEADTFKLYCYQTLTGVKFIIITEPNQPGMEIMLRRIYELYADYALKNPFYSLDMPIRCDLFDVNLKNLIDTLEKLGVSGL